MKALAALSAFLPALGLTFSAVASSADPLYSTSFSNLSGWRTVAIPGVDRSASFESIRRPEGSWLNLRSDNAASALLLDRTFSTATAERLRWRWRVKQLPTTGDPTTKVGDDYVVRVLLLFKDATGGMGSLFESLFGAELMPDSSIHYVWSAGGLPDSGIPSPYTDRVYIKSLEAGIGSGDASEWRTAAVEPASDYRRFFGAEPPGRLAIAVMIDTDSSHTRGEAEITDLELLGSDPGATP